MPEKLPQNNKLEQREKTQIQSDGMSEKLNRESINKLSTQFSIALGEKFEKKGIAFNIQEFKSKITKSIEQVFLNPNIPDIAKEKFKQDLMSKIDLLSSVNIDDINALKNRRIVESLGVEYIELRGKSEGEKQAFFLSKILEETIGKYIEPVSYSLISAFDGEKTRVGSTEYGKKNLDDFTVNIKSLDTLYGLNIGEEIRNFQRERIKKGLGDISREDLYREMGLKIVAGMNKRKTIPDAGRVSEFIRNGNLTNNSKGGRLTEASLPDGSKKDIVGIILEYKKHIVSFQGVETESRETREVALADDAISRAKKGLGMEQLKSEFDHLKPTDIEAKMKNKSFADMVIIATQLAQLAPIAGDIGGGIDGIVSAYSGMNVDGAKLSHLERGMNTIFGVLGISVMGGWAARAKNANKVKGLLESFSVMKKYLPEKFEAFLKAGGKLSEEAKTGIMKFAKMMGEEFAQQIEGMMKKNGMILGFTEQPTTRHGIISKPMQLPKTPRTIESVLSDKKFQNYYAQFGDENLMEIYRSNNLHLGEMLVQKYELDFIRSLEERGYGVRARELFDKFYMSPKHAINERLKEMGLTWESKMDELISKFEDAHMKKITKEVIEIPPRNFDDFIQNIDRKYEITESKMKEIIIGLLQGKYGFEVLPEGIRRQFKMLFRELVINLHKGTPIEVGAKMTAWISATLASMLYIYGNQVLDNPRIPNSYGVLDQIQLWINEDKIKTDKYLQYLWPNGFSNKLEQGAVGNCYFVAALEGLKRNQNCQRILQEIIKPGIEPGSWEINFKGGNKTIIISKQDVDYMRQFRMGGNLGDNILEMAYWINRIDKHNSISNLTKNIPNIYYSLYYSGKEEDGDQYVKLVGNSIMVNWGNLFDKNGEPINTGGFQGQVYEDIFGNMIEKNNTYQISQLGDSAVQAEASESDIRNAYTYDPSQIIDRIRDFIPDITEKKIQEIQERASKGDRLDIYDFSVIDYFGEEKRITFNHAYTIGQFGGLDKDGWVEVINPWDTEGNKIILKINDFKKYFAGITLTKFKRI